MTNFEKAIEFISNSTFYLVIFSIWMIVGAIGAIDEGTIPYIFLMGAILGNRGEVNYRKLKKQISLSFSEKDKVENFMCFFVDKYENQALGEEQLSRTWFEFLKSDYNKKKEQK